MDMNGISNRLKICLTSDPVGLGFFSLSTETTHVTARQIVKPNGIKASAGTNQVFRHHDLSSLCSTTS